jgi:hypothetical protein
LSRNQGQDAKNAILPQERHGDFLPRLIDPREFNGAFEQKIDPFRGVSGEKNSFTALKGFHHGGESLVAQTTKDGR